MYGVENVSKKGASDGDSLAIAISPPEICSRARDPQSPAAASLPVAGTTREGVIKLDRPAACNQPLSSTSPGPNPAR